MARKRKLRPFKVVVHEIVRRHLDAANMLTGREDATTLTPIERDALANLITDEIVADYEERTKK
jgi:phage-related protein